MNLLLVFSLGLWLNLEDSQNLLKWVDIFANSETQEEHIIPQKLHQQASQGDSQAQYQVGIIYLKAAQYNQAFSWFKKAADNKHPAALFNLGILYEQGLGVNKSQRLAAENYYFAAQSGLLQARFNWAMSLRDGVPEEKGLNLKAIKPNEQEAINLFQQLINEKFLPAKKELAILFLTANNEPIQIQKGLSLLKEAANEGDIVAMRLLAEQLIQQTSIPPSISQNPMEDAFIWIKKAAEHDDIEAIAKLGWFYEYGIGTEKSLPLAVSAYQKAAQANNSMAQVCLADCFMEGRGVEKNLDLALGNYVKAARQNDPIAFYKLGCCSLYGIGQEVNKENAAQFFLTSAQLNYALGKLNYAMLILTEKSLNRDQKEGIFWLKSAAEDNEPSAIYRLAICYLQGNFVLKDTEYGMHLLKKAARLGNPEASLLLKNIIQKSPK